MKAYESVLKDWAKEFRAGLDAETLRLIPQANFDLYYGPHSEDDYPGFEIACKRIGEAIDIMPSTLYLDADSGCWSEVEPTEDDGGEWYAVGRSELVRALVGKELAQYV